MDTVVIWFHLLNPLLDLRPDLLFHGEGVALLLGVIAQEFWDGIVSRIQRWSLSELCLRWTHWSHVLVRVSLSIHGGLLFADPLLLTLLRHGRHLWVAQQLVQIIPIHKVCHLSGSNIRSMVLTFGGRKWILILFVVSELVAHFLWMDSMRRINLVRSSRFKLLGHRVFVELVILRKAKSWVATQRTLNRHFSGLWHVWLLRVHLF